MLAMLWWKFRISGMEKLRKLVRKFIFFLLYLLLLCRCNSLNYPRLNSTKYSQKSLSTQFPKITQSKYQADTWTLLKKHYRLFQPQKNLLRSYVQPPKQTVSIEEVHLKNTFLTFIEISKDQYCKDFLGNFRLVSTLMVIIEYDRIGRWSFHAKGVWIKEAINSYLTVVGSSNYNRRSEERDT